MSPFSRLSIAGKLRSSFGILLLITALTGSAGIWGLVRVESTIVEVNDLILRQVAFSSEAYNNLIQHNRRLYRHVATDSPETMQQTEAQIQLNETLIRDLFEKHSRSHEIPPDTEKRIIGRINQVYPEYQMLADRIVKLSAAGRKGEAMRLLESEEHTLFKDLDRNFSDLVRFNIEEAKTAHAGSMQLYQGLRYGVMLLMVISLLIGMILAENITQGIVTPIRRVLDLFRGMEEQGKERARLAVAIASGNLDQRLTVQELEGEGQDDGATFPHDEGGILLRAARSLQRLQRGVDLAFNRMADSLKASHQAEEKRSRRERGVFELTRILRGDRPLEESMKDALGFICRMAGANVGRFLCHDERRELLLPMAGHAVSDDESEKGAIPVGSGIAGEAARSRTRIVVSAVPEGYLTISSALGEAPPREIAAFPLIHDERLVGVLELGSFVPFSPDSLELLDGMLESLAVGISVILSRKMIDELLEQTQSQAEELRVQQEELQQSNEELEERAELLERQREQIRLKNRELEATAEELRAKAEELERVSSYKSQFLANMSHELRTPLNSVLVLSSLLQENRDGNLTDRQLEYAATIQQAGKDLLELIDEVLDLARIESGQLNLVMEPISLQPMLDRLHALFAPLAENRGLSFSISMGEGVPDEIRSDPKRLPQILRNLLSNAFKFTHGGGVTLTVSPLDADSSPLGLPSISFAVKDTGIGIPADKQELIFHAFQQVDGSTSRRYGGTGLGLTISRELARGLGGDIVLQSTEGEGSTFTLLLPLHGADAAPLSPPGGEIASPPAAPTTPPLSITTETPMVAGGERCILVIEDDPVFSRLLGGMIERKGFSFLAAPDGETGVELARRMHPAAIILDVMLPGIDGWEVMRRLKEDPGTRRIPVHFVTCVDEQGKGIELGAAGYLTKPVTADALEGLLETIERSIGRDGRSVLLVEDDEMAARSISELLAARGIATTTARRGKEAIDLLRRERFDAIILDLGLPDMPAEAILDAIHSLEPSRRPPVIVHSGKELTGDEEMTLKRHAERIIIKGVKSHDRLLDEISLFLSLVDEERRGGEDEWNRPRDPGEENLLAGRKILLVDDDMRNLFSLSSFLADRGMVVFEADNGRTAISLLDQNPDIDLVIMDVMMPEMDGLTTVRRIRRDPRFADLPIIMLTAKAMKDDRDECMAAGASDYLSKPVDLDRLLTILRVWLYGRA